MGLRVRTAWCHGSGMVRPESVPSLRRPGAAGTGCAGHQECSSSFPEKPLLNPPTTERTHCHRTFGFHAGPGEPRLKTRRAGIDPTRLLEAGDPNRGKGRTAPDRTEGCRPTESEQRPAGSDRPAFLPAPSCRPLPPGPPLIFGLGGLPGRAAGPGRCISMPC